jgi:hypothetical protein
MAGGKVSAAEGREGNGWLEYGWLGVGRRGLRSTEDRGRRTEERQVQKCKSEQSSYAKVERWWQREYRVQSTEYGFGRHEVGAGLCRALLG